MLARIGTESMCAMHRTWPIRVVRGRNRNLCRNKRRRRKECTATNVVCEEMGTHRKRLWYIHRCFVEISSSLPCKLWHNRKCILCSLEWATALLDHLIFCPHFLFEEKKKKRKTAAVRWMKQATYWNRLSTLQMNQIAGRHECASIARNWKSIPIWW